MAAALADLSIGMPIAPLFSVMDEASFWADMATTQEKKAYALACNTRLRPADQSAFVAYPKVLGLIEQAAECPDYDPQHDLTTDTGTFLESSLADISPTWR